MERGFIKVDRNIFESKIFAHPIALKIWLWCLGKATYKERYVPFKIGRSSITVKLLAGQFIFGRSKAEKELNIDGSTVWKWMKKFATDDFKLIEMLCNNQYSIITICKWHSYQYNIGSKVTTMEQPKTASKQFEYQHIDNVRVTTKEHKQEEEVYKERNNNTITNEENVFENLSYQNFLSAASKAREYIGGIRVPIPEYDNDNETLPDDFE